MVDSGGKVGGMSGGLWWLLVASLGDVPRHGQKVGLKVKKKVNTIP